jgi:hypothetical protein
MPTGMPIASQRMTAPRRGSSSLGMLLEELGEDVSLILVGEPEVLPVAEAGRMPR